MLPADLVVRVAPDIVVHDGGRLVIGGAPVRLLRLSARGAVHVARWRAGAPIGDDPAVRALAERLLEAGILLPDPQPAGPVLAQQVTVAIPVRNRPQELSRCLRALRADAPDVPMLVVDDASADGAGIDRVARAHGASVVRLERRRGPAAARNAGLRAAVTPLVAFVDSDVVIERGWLARLAASFADPRLAAAAPRIAPLYDRGGLLTEYEARHSSLDIGDRPGLVGPARAVPYVPSAALVVRRESVGEGFDPALTIGEDVDFVWRLAAGRARVLYDPGATVRHDHRVKLLPFVRRRLTYAWSIGPLSRRHPHALPVMRVEPWSVSALVLLGSGRIEGALGAAIALSARAARTRKLLAAHTDRPGRLAARLTGRATLGSARGLGHAVRRAWSPVLVPLAVRSPRVRFLLVTAVVGAALDESVRPRHLPTKLLDDGLAAVGTWGGCLSQRTLRPLLPARSRGQIAKPPSTGSAAPVIPSASGPASHTIAAAISRG